MTDDLEIGGSRKENSISMLQVWLVANTIAWPFNLKLSGLTLSLNVIFLIPFGLVWLWRRRTIVSSSARVLVLLLGYLAFSWYVAVSGPCNDKLPKLLMTAPVMAFLVLIGWEAGRTANNSDWLKLEKAALGALWAGFAGFLVEMAVPSWFAFQQGFRAEGKFSGLFTEPSHVAFSLFPCIAILLVSQKRKMRRWGMWALFGLFLLSRSSTLIALTASWFLYRLIIQRKLRSGALFGLGVILLIGLGAIINYETLLAPTVVRIIGIVASSDTNNLSSLVYVQGWEDAWENLSRTHGLGLGFNMMGCHPLPEVPIRAILSIGGMDELNAEDGSFQFGKIVSEAGVAGIAFYVAIIWWWFQLEKRIRKIGHNADCSAVTMQAALIFCFVASSFIRGAGYFSAGILLWLIAVSGASKWQSSLITKEASGQIGLKRLIMNRQGQ